VRHRLVSFVGALALFLLPFPIASLTLLFLLLSGKGELRYQSGLSIPSTSDPNTWKDYRYLRLHLCAATMAGWWTYFVAGVWLGLISVLKGDLFLMGLKPRSREEVKSLASDWKSLYLSSKSGLITEAFVMFGRTPLEDELYTAEAYYSATESIRHDLKLLRLYLTRLLTSNERSAVEDFSGGPGLAASPGHATER
jgi:lipopolysaccharide/colanic/teichoic acid biosynthesis glycosyltransferase